MISFGRSPSFRPDHQHKRPKTVDRTPTAPLRVLRCATDSGGMICNDRHHLEQRLDASESGFIMQWGFPHHHGIIWSLHEYSIIRTGTDARQKGQQPPTRHLTICMMPSRSTTRDPVKARTAAFFLDLSPRHSWVCLVFLANNCRQ